MVLIKNKIKMNETDTYIKQNILHFGEEQICYLFYLFAKDRLLFDGKDWWIFVKYAWRQDEESVHMIWTLFKSNHLSTLLLKHCNEITNVEDKNRVIHAIEILLHDIEKRKRYIYKVLKYNETLLYHSTFLQIKDTKTKHLHFLNGVYDLNIKAFRSTEPEDYNTITTRCMYRREGSKDRSKLLTYLDEIIGNDQIPKLLQIMREIMFCETKNKVVGFIGSPNSGRSTFLDLICVMLGDYFQNLSCARLPGSSTIHHILNHQGCRFVLLEIYSQYPVIPLDKCLTIVNREPLTKNYYQPSYTLVFDLRYGNEPLTLQDKVEMDCIHFISKFDTTTYRQEWKALEFKDEMIQFILEFE